MKIYYNPKLKPLARKLRNNSTMSEILLWEELKGRKMKGYQFLRQKPIGEYIVDFFCSQLKLVIEIDGDSHNKGNYKYDLKRQKWLESIDLTILRFDDIDVKKDMKNVLMSVEGWINEYERVYINK